jgi:NADH-quinone oxidoreductase subunit E/NADP-reducing hydrogenase subunit HndA
MQKINNQSMKVINEITERYKDSLGPVKLMLHDVQVELGFIPFEAMEAVANATGTPISEVYGVVTFYTQFTTEPKGKYVINVCMGTACYVLGAQKLLDEVIALTEAPVNGTSEDQLFSVDATRCLGACGLAVLATINGKVFGNACVTGAVEEYVKEVIKNERT